MTRHMFFTLMLAFGLLFSAQAQTTDPTVTSPAAHRQALRDSLRQATEQLVGNEFDLDLRLKKAAWNIELEQWDYALDDLDKALLIDKYSRAGLFYRAYVNERLRRYAFARQDYENLLVLVPGNFAARLGLALVNESDNHKSEAYDQMNLLVEQFPDSSIVWEARAGMEEGRGWLELAEYDFSKAIAINAMSLNAYEGRCRVRTALGRRSDAMADLRRLRELGGDAATIKELFDRLDAKR